MGQSYFQTTHFVGVADMSVQYMYQYKYRQNFHWVYQNKYLHCDMDCSHNHQAAGHN